MFNVADGIRTTALGCRKRRLYQLNHHLYIIYKEEADKLQSNTRGFKNLNSWLDGWKMKRTEWLVTASVKLNRLQMKKNQQAKGKALIYCCEGYDEVHF